VDDEQLRALYAEIGELIRKAILFDRMHLHTSQVAKVISYDSQKQTATVQPMVKRQVPKEGGGLEFQLLPQIPDVRVGWLEGGGASLQMKLSPGDFVSLIFDEVDASQWRESGQEGEPTDLELHGYSSCWALPVMRPRSGALRNVTTGPHLEVPPGQFMSVGTDPGLMNFVALSNKVDQGFSKVQADLSTLKAAIFSALTTVDSSAGSASSGPFNTAAAGVPQAISSTAASKLKTE
jgi:hypothetical protein